MLADLKSPSREMRAATALALTAVVDDQAVADALCAAFADPEEEVREAVVWALSERKTGHPRVSDLSDEPPRTLEVTRPGYPRKAFDNKVEGVVVVAILISASGKVVRAKILRSVPGLDEEALRCARQWTFKPARLKGSPVPAVAHAPVGFHLH